MCSLDEIILENVIVHVSFSCVSWAKLEVPVDRKGNNDICTLPSIIWKLCIPNITTKNHAWQNIIKC
jgi:hypothetical protein